MMMTLIKYNFLLISIAILVLSAGWIVISAPDSQETTGGLTPAPREGFLAPDFTLDTLTGEKIHLRDLKGSAVIINLWATWCPPCRAEMPALQKVSVEYAERGLVVLAVNMTAQDNLGDINTFVKDFQLTMPVLLDGDGSVSSDYQAKALPTTFFIDQDNVIKKVVIGGPLPESLLRIEAEKLLEDVD